MQTKLKFIKNSVYKLKRSYGMPAVLHKITSHILDPNTGNKTTVLGSIYINKLIVLRAREFRSFVYDLAYISANKDFTTGGFFDPNDRHAIVDAKDLDGYVPKVSDYIVFDNARYNIVEAQEFEDNYGYILLLRKIKGADVVRIETTHSGLILNDSTAESIDDNLIRTVQSTLSLIDILKEVP